VLFNIFVFFLIIFSLPILVNFALTSDVIV